MVVEKTDDLVLWIKSFVFSSVLENPKEEDWLYKTP